MKILFLDCFSGISGDMTVGALVDLGVKPSTLEWELSKLAIGDFHMHFDRQQRRGVEGVKFGIHEGATHNHDQDEHGHSHEHGHHHHHEEKEEHGHSHEHGDCDGHGHSHSHEHGEHHHHEAHTHEAEAVHEHDRDHGCEVHGHHHEHTHEHVHGRNHREIRELIERSELSPFVKKHALSIFARLAEAEGKIHGQPAAEVGFHEVGALDSIADIICACVGLETLGVKKVFVSPLHEGHGTIRCAHGTFPLPAPATLEILKGIPLAEIDEHHELITPTGAAIVAEFGTGFGPMPRMKTEKIGYGVGTRDLASRPNVLRAVLGELVGD
jgi:pyridinium-3,5-bisthiocarboxylic acid mononucleotide nickel chelatase